MQNGKLHTSEWPFFPTWKILLLLDNWVEFCLPFKLLDKISGCYLWISSLNFCKVKLSYSSGCLIFEPILFHFLVVFIRRNNIHSYFSYLISSFLNGVKQFFWLWFCPFVDRQQWGRLALDSCWLYEVIISIQTNDGSIRSLQCFLRALFCFCAWQWGFTLTPHP